MKFERPDLRPDGPDFKPERPDSRLEKPDLRTEWPDGGDGRTNERTDERKSPCVLQDFVSFGAAAQKSSQHLLLDPSST